MMPIVKSNLPGGPAWSSAVEVTSGDLLQGRMIPPGAEDALQVQPTSDLALGVPANPNLKPTMSKSKCVTHFHIIMVSTTRCMVATIYNLLSHYLLDVRAEFHKAIAGRLAANELSLALIPAITRKDTELRLLVMKEGERLVKKIHKLHHGFRTSSLATTDTCCANMLDTMEICIIEGTNIRNEMRDSIPAMIKNLQLHNIISDILVDAPDTTKHTIDIEAILNIIGQKLVDQLDLGLTIACNQMRFQTTLFMPRYQEEASALFLQSAMTANILRLQRGQPIEKKKRTRSIALGDG
jgi:hypothetical protein